MLSCESKRQPTLAELQDIYRFLRKSAGEIRSEYGPLFGARAFRGLVVLATEFVNTQIR